MIKEYTFLVEKQCPVCNKNARIIKIKSKLVAEKVDEDYCCHYKDFNPYLYNIWVCEHCGFAADEKVFLGSLSAKKKEAITKFLAKNQVHFEFNDERSVPDGLASLQLGIYCAEALEAPIARLAGMTLRMAWIYRLIGNTEEERKCEERALNLYERSLYKERFPIDTLTDYMVMYLIGVLYYRLGYKDKAVLYLSRLVSDKEAKRSNDMVYTDARKLWQDIQEEKKLKEG